MTSVLNFLKGLSRHKFHTLNSKYLKKFTQQAVRHHSDEPPIIPANQNAKQVVVQGTENEEKLRVRRARPGDVPRVLRFVKENARCAWPGLVSNSGPQSAHIVLCDYVARTLAQGHSMLAEQQEPRRGWTQIRGVALSASVAPWDAVMLDKWGRCLRCASSRRLVSFTSHCLGAPALHDKYQVHNIMQVIILVPPENTRSPELISLLAKHAIQRARDHGFPLIRFDVTNESLAKSLEEMNLNKEWHFSYNVQSDSQNKPAENQEMGGEGVTDADGNPIVRSNFIAVYTMLTGGNSLTTT